MKLQIIFEHIYWDTMGTTCNSEPKEYELADVCPMSYQVKVMSLDYGKAFYTPMEIFINGSEHKLWELSKLFLKEADGFFEDFQEFDSPEQALGPFMTDFKKGRYSPLFDQTTGLQKKGKGQDKQWFLLPEQKFFQLWDKRFQVFKKSKVNKKKYDAFKAQELKTWKQNLRRYDFFMLRMLVEQIMGRTYKECVDQKVSMGKYLNIVQNQFNYQFLDENKKISILFFELSKIYPHIFFIQNTSKQLHFRFSKESNDCFRFFKNNENAPEQLIIINRYKFPGEEFIQVDVEQETKRLLPDREENEESSVNESSIPPESMSEDGGEHIEGQKGKQHGSKIIQGSKVIENEKEKESRIRKDKEEKEKKKAEEKQLRKLKREAFLMVSSQNYLLISLNFSKDEDLREEQESYFGQLYEAMLKDDTMKYQEKIIIVGGSFQSSDFDSPEGMAAYPTQDEDYTYFTHPLPVSFDIGDIEKAEDDQQIKEIRHRIIANRKIKQNLSRITLIDGKTPAYKKESENNPNGDELVVEKDFENEEEEQDYEFSKKSGLITRIPCDIHPFEGYLIQAVIEKFKKVSKEDVNKDNSQINQYENSSQNS